MTCILVTRVFKFIRIVIHVNTKCKQH